MEWDGWERRRRNFVMQPFRKVKGKVVPLDGVNVDTDQIIPKQFLKLVERKGFGKYLFYDWRYDGEGKLRNDFVLNLPEYQGAKVLLARANFGCGSSREHAVWALYDYGFSAVIAPSFADIFLGNSFKNGLLPVSVPEEKVELLFEKARRMTGYEVTVDLETQAIYDEYGLRIPFSIDPHKRRLLLEGLDDISITLIHEEKIKEYERKIPRYIFPSEF